MKKLKILALLCTGVLALSGCTSAQGTESSVETTETTTSEVQEKSYKPVTFTDMPETITDSYSAETVDIAITGYLSSSISKDGSVGYLWNTGYGTTPAETTVGKCVVLDLSSSQKDETIVGDQFVTVTGSVMTEDYYDVYNTKSSWHLKVDSIVVEEELPDNVQEYENYMASYEWEAFAKTIDFIGTAIYNWQSDETLVELDLELLECDMDSAIEKTKSDYPKIYETIKEYLNEFTEYYNTVKTCINEKTRPEDVESLYNNMRESYAGLSDDLVMFGCFE